MRILYGVSGVGLGHSSRAMMIAEHLEKEGHKVKILTFGDAYDILKKNFDCIEVKGLEIVFENGGVKKRKTFFHNLKNFPKNLFCRRKFAKLMRSFRPDLCITDMEAVVSILSKLYKIPLISVDNNHILTNFKVKIPLRYWKESFFTKQVIRGVTGKTRTCIVSSFTNLPAKKKNSFLVPLIVRNDVLRLKGKYGKKILVYISKGDFFAVKELKKIDEEFVVYGFGVKRRDGNLEFKMPETFLKDLEDCKFIIGTSGFSLMSEAIYLKKPYLAVPIKKHFEQMLNAILLRQSKFGDFAEELTGKKIKNFMKKLSYYRKNLSEFNTDQKEIFKVIDKKINEIKIKNKI